MDDRRLLLAVALSLLLLTAYSLLFPPPPPKPRGPASPSPAAPATSAPASPGAEASAAAPVQEAPPSADAVGDEKERRIEVANADVSAAFTNRGARVLSWRMLKFADSRGRPEELVQALPAGPRALDLETGDATLDARLLQVLYRPSTENLTVGARPETLRFEFSDGEVSAVKELTFSPRGYVVEARASVQRRGQPLDVRLVWGPGVGNPTRAERDVQGYQPPQGAALGSGGLSHFPPTKLPPTGQPMGVVRWAGVESRYFAALLVPPGDRGGALLRSFPLPAYDDGKENLAPVVAIDLARTSDPSHLYVGPKDYQEMKAAGHEFDRLVLYHMGEWIGPPIVVPLMRLVQRVNGVVGNYGWSIVLVTMLINLVMAPLRHYSIANGLKMAKISPEMRAIQERYRRVPLMDPKRQEMQEEMAALYAKHGMSMGTQMLVGCLPVLLTMPFLIAFYRVLTVSIELRGASFLWIPDLSQRDPLFLTPILMGLSMFLMQKMMPTTMDPAQQRIMMLMPIMLSGLFLWAPAGLNLYWFTSNLCSIVQQAVTQRILRNGGTPAPARKRK
jgi:YidC/Oxa1 family membrane protein insertase